MGHDVLQVALAVQHRYHPVSSPQPSVWKSPVCPLARDLLFLYVTSLLVLSVSLVGYGAFESTT